VRILDQDMLTEFKELCQELDMAYEKIERLELAVNELNFAIETLLEGDKDV
jgi:anti-sigma regulatory factor (Ser/Thr protein kinase)